MMSLVTTRASRDKWMDGMGGEKRRIDVEGCLREM